MKVGDLVQPVLGKDFPEEPQVGMVIEVINDTEVPPVCKVLWPMGIIDKEWSDELEVVSDDPNEQVPPAQYNI